MSWEKVKLRDLLWIRNGKDHKHLNEGIYPVYGSGGVLRYVDKYLYDKKSVLLPRKGSLNNIQYAEVPFWSVDTCYYTEIFEDKVVPYFLFSALRKYDVAALNTGAAVPSMTFEKYYNIDVEIPNLETQRAISYILSRYDNLISNYRKQIKLLEEAAQRIYKEWFVDMRFPGHETAKFNEDGLPEGWEKVTINDVCSTIGGGTPSTKIESYYSGGQIKWVTPTDITRSQFLCKIDTEKKITEEGLNNSSAKMLPSEAILMTSRASIGFFGIYSCPVCTNQGFISCVPYNANTQMYLLYNLMDRVAEIRQKAGGSTFLEISKSNFRSMKIVRPTDSILDLFQNEAHDIFEQTRNLTKQIALLTEARDRLLPKLMSGAIEV